MRALFVIILFAAFVLPPIAFAEVQTFTATHTYVLGDHDSKDDARQRCLLEAKRKILEQAGVYIESASQVKNFDLTEDKITSFAAAVMHVKDTREEVGFQQGHMTLTLKLTAQVDLSEVRKQQAARQLDASVREDVAVQKERLKYLETQLEAIQRQIQQAPERTPAPPMRDISAADVHTLRTLAVQGDAGAQNFLGVLYADGKGVSRDYVKARQWYEKAAAQGDAMAKYNLGLIYAQGQGVPKDYDQAQQWVEKAAVQGNASAQTYLGALYGSGKGVPQDHVKARQWYEQAAIQGNVSSQAVLGALYRKGQGVPQDYVKARQWFEKAAVQGNAGAQFALGVMYNNADGVAKDYATARQWYEQAAIQGDADAQNNLGRLYFLGQGVPQDNVQARYWFEKAAAQGEANAQSYLGALHANGLGVPQNYTTARQWWEKSAAQGDTRARLNLGALYLLGQGVTKDDMRAHMWINLAAAHSEGDLQKLAVDTRYEVASHMTPAQIAEAQRLSQQCQAQKFKGC